MRLKALEAAVQTFVALPELGEPVTNSRARRNEQCKTGREQGQANRNWCQQRDRADDQADDRQHFDEQVEQRPIP